MNERRLKLKSRRGQNIETVVHQEGKKKKRQVWWGGGANPRGEGSVGLKRCIPWERPKGP